MRLFTYVCIVVIINHTSRLPSLLLSFHFPCLHTRDWVPLKRWFQLFRSPRNLALWTEGIHWFLSRINSLHHVQALLTRLEKLIVLLLTEGHVLLKLFLEFTYSNSTGVYHTRLLLLLHHLLLCVLVWINQRLLRHLLWLKLCCLQFSLFEQLVIS